METVYLPDAIIISLNLRGSNIPYSLETLQKSKVAELDKLSKRKVRMLVLHSTVHNTWNDELLTFFTVIWDD